MRSRRLQIQRRQLDGLLILQVITTLQQMDGAVTKREILQPNLVVVVRHIFFAIFCFLVRVMAINCATALEDFFFQLFNPLAPELCIQRQTSAKPLISRSMRFPKGFGSSLGFLGTVSSNIRRESSTSFSF